MTKTAVLRGLLWLFAGIGVLAASHAGLSLFDTTTKSHDVKDLIFSDFVYAVDNGEVVSVTLDGNMAVGRLKDDTPFVTNVPDTNAGLIRNLLEKKVRVTAVPASANTPWSFYLVIYWVPIIAGFLFWWLLVAKPLRSIERAIERLAPTYKQSV